MLAIAGALRAKGAEAIVAAPRLHEAVVRSSGSTWVEAYRGLDMSAITGSTAVLSGRGGRARVLRALAEGVPPHYADMRAVLRSERIDAVATHPFALGTVWACDEERVPWATVALSPMAWYARTDPVPLVQRAPGQARFIVGRVIDRMTRRSVRWIGSALFNPLRRRCGLPAWHRCLERTVHGGAINLGLWSPAFRGPTAMDPVRSSIVGFARWEEDGAGGSDEPGRSRGPDGSGGSDDMDASGVAMAKRIVDGPPGSVRADVAASDSPLIVVALGTTAVHVGGTLFASTAAAIARLRCRAILLTGTTAETIVSPSPAIRIERYLPLRTVLPGTVLFVHHGGAGSVAEALHAGVPSLVVPHAFDQHHNALHLVRLGLGRMLVRSRATVATLEVTLRAMLDDDALHARCRAFATSIATEDGATAAAQALLDLSRRTRSP